tara:strand:+ start:483 stop:617 length:135 start_codon:yes stop_codon:yes gene_type:complete
VLEAGVVLKGLYCGVVLEATSLLPLSKLGARGVLEADDGMPEEF